MNVAVDPQRGLVLGLAALIRPVTIQGELVRRELPLLLLATAVLLVMVLDGPLQGTTALLNRTDGIVLLLLFTIFLYVNTMDLRSQPDDALIRDVKEAGDALPVAVRQTERHTLLLVGGMIGSHLGATKLSPRTMRRILALIVVVGAVRAALA